MHKKLLFTIIPKGYWIALTIAFAILIIGGKYTPLANIIFNLLLFLTGLKAAVLFHETGHLLFAKLVGGRPRRMVLGKGHKVFQTEVYGIKVILNANFNSGLAYAAFDKLSFIRIKLFAYISGGFLINFLIAALLFLGFGVHTNLSDGIQLASAIAMANLLAGISALIPYRVHYQGLRLYSDGLSILKIPFYKRAQLAELSHTSELLDAYDFFEAGNYKEAIRIYEHFQSKAESPNAVNINLSMAYLKSGDFQKAAELMETLIPLAEDNSFKRHRHFVYNGLAWVYLLQNRLDEADTYSELAHKLDPGMGAIRGTRASVLIEKGRFEEGKNLIIDDVDFNFPNNQTLAAAIYLGIAFHKLGAPEKAEKYMTFVDDHLELLDIDEKILYDRALEKIADNKQNSS